MTIFVFAIAACLQLAAADQPASKAPAKHASEAKPLVVPAGAVETEAGTFRYTDPQGKKWLYRKTPFGVARMEDKGAGAAAASEPIAPPKSARVKATEEGDTVHFERPGPFGVYKWDRKKAELSDAERGWLEQSRRESGSKSSRQE